ncbi:hypothetical protein FJV76_13555 [Mesorhizobium sp. WSM4303]|nr:hypothetical protein FJV77_07665 [Mesorhizobium sp. WSM4306]TRD04311.1 hypothetical protein FJV76_13555 [Mesorhizobium sp. WSM4303]
MDEHPKCSVSIAQLDGQWAVQIVEAGTVTKRLFEREEFARNYAAGQWLRLNPKPVLPKSRRKPKV